MTRTWSQYQEKLFDFGLNESGNALIQAVAGSGKTSTIEELARRMPDNLQICYLVFNKKNADEAQERMPSNVTASTFHSAGTRALRKELGSFVVNSRKSDEIMQEILRMNRHKLIYPVSRLVSLGKNHGIGVLTPDTDEEWIHLLDHYGSGVENDDDISWRDLIYYARQVIETGNYRTHVLDFDDMLYLAVKLDVEFPTYDLVCVDEAQDTNPIQHAFLKKLVGNRVIAVGDSRQAIYGFRGASTNAMTILKNDFNCTELPLSINYRCGKKIIDQAKPYCPEIQAWEDSPEGEVSSLAEFKMENFDPSDAILCRNVAPLVALGYRMIRGGIACTILGRDIGVGLNNLIKKVCNNRLDKTIDQMLDGLSRWEDRESAKFYEKGQDDMVEQIRDKAESVRVVAESLPEDKLTIEDLMEAITSLFSTAGGRQVVTLCTVHKAKGLEWNRVFILEPKLMPSPWAKKAWQVEQENNLLYVAITRAKLSLNYLPLESVIE